MVVDTGGQIVGMVPRSQGYDITPSASRLSHSLRDIGYDFSTALADLVDNSIAAGARTVDLFVSFAGKDSSVVIADDGVGMTETTLNEALRFGTRRQYAEGELGRYGLGLKTASLSQCRRLTVVTRHTPVRRTIRARQLDLDYIERFDRWEVREPFDFDPVLDGAWDHLEETRGTVVIWQGLDRVLPADNPSGGWARRRLETLSRVAADYLSMVFHRYLEGLNGEPPVTIAMNGTKLEPWNPSAPGEQTEHRPSVELELAIPGSVNSATVRFTPWILPPRERFSSQAEWERMSGPQKWNRQQGLYVYRSDRLIQAGGWAGLRAIDEHTKLARAALDFPTTLDAMFRVNVAKMRVALPPELRPLLERPINELCKLAGLAYRGAGSGTERRPEASAGRFQMSERPASTAMADAGVALRAAAMETDDAAALTRIMCKLRERNPQVAGQLGF